ncbi:MAG: hypothetical protein ABIK28_01890, partial [Planctomycetota bacterium]
NVLETYHRRHLRFLMYQLNDDFQLRPLPESNCAALGSSLIELLKVSDRRPFTMVIQGVLHAILKEYTHINPFVAAALADAGMSNNKLFEEVLTYIRDHSEPEGRIPFGSELLGEEGPYTTLFSLNLLKKAKRESDHSSVIEPALEYLQETSEDLLEESPVVAARIMAAAAHFGPEAKKALAEKCLDNLVERLNENNRWDESPLGLGVDAEVVCALLEAAPVLGRKAVATAEKWLTQVFGLDLSGDLPEWPPLFEEIRKNTERPDLWLESLLRATLAAALYLAHERPEHNPAAYLLALSVPQENILVRAEEMIKLASPYLPRLDDVKRRAPQLETFWQSAVPFDQSVFVMCGANPSNEQSNLIKAVAEALWNHKLAGRNLTEGGLAYLSDPWENAALFMTGCRYGIALLEGAIESPPAELVYQVGFMRGQGTPILVLWDQSVQEQKDVKFPGVRSPMKGIEAAAYDSREIGLAGLRDTVEKWAQSLLNPETASQAEE